MPSAARQREKVSPARFFASAAVWIVGMHLAILFFDFLFERGAGLRDLQSPWVKNSNERVMKRICRGAEFTRQMCCALPYYCYLVQRNCLEF